MVLLPSRNEELKKSLCKGLGGDECVKKVSSQLMAEEQHERSNHRILVERYLRSLTFWDRVRLGKVEPGPEPEKLKAVEGFSGKSSPFVLEEIGIQIHLRERWTAPSFRSTSGGETSCNPDKLTACSTEERWEDGRRLQAWVCGPPAAAEPDCSGRASFVRAEAGFEESKLSEGRSVWVEPGRLAQAYMELVTDRTVKLETLQMARHSIEVHRLPGAYVVTGGFAHGMYANGSWFPLVVAVPLSLAK